MALDLQVIREALAGVIRDGVAESVNVHAYYPASALMLPAIVIRPADEYVEYYDAFAGGLASVSLEVEFYVPATVSGQILLDEFLSAGAEKPSSVVDALEDDRNFDNTVSDTKAGKARSLGRVTIGDESIQSPCFVAVLPIAVWLPRT